MELTKSQNLVINTKNKSLLVSASAGSGKTFVVVERIIDGIKHGQDVSRLLVLTFTNAAAAELKERLVKKLYELKDEYIKEGKQEEAKSISKQIAKVPMADISTIHSFCLNIIRNNFYSLGIDPCVTTLDATKATIMLNDTIVEVIETEYEKQEIEFLDILDILGSEETLITTIYQLYMQYKKVLDSSVWLEKSKAMYETKPGTDLLEIEFGKVLAGSIKSRLEVLKLEIEKLIDELDSLDDFLTRKEMLESILFNITCALEFKTFDELYASISELQSLPRLPSTKVSDEELKDRVKELKTKVTEELKALKLIAYKDSNGIIQELNDNLKYITWYINVVHAVDEKYTTLKKEKGVIDFADYEYLALKALNDDTVRAKYIEKYEEIYIDEYQDTSNTQEAIITKIAKSNNVIMVGDVKQSIYGFRDAKPDLFSSKYIRLEEVTEENNDLHEGKIILAQNFRSRKEVLDSINDIFYLLMSESFGGARYEDKEALVYGEGYEEVEDDRYKTEINIIEKETEDDALLEDVSNVALEAQAVSNKINELISSGFEVYDLKKKEYRKCEYKDIVILLRTVENKANIVSDILTQNGIPAYADSKSGFYKSDEINLIISFLKVLDNPYDDIALASVMYSIIGGFTLDDLALIRNKYMHMPVIEALETCKEELEDSKLKDKTTSFLELLNRFKDYLKAYKISDILLKLYDETGIYEALRLDNTGTLKCANLDNFVKIVSEFEELETMSSLHLLLNYLNVLKAKESASDSPKLLGENENVVRIMTIHKSKGLEFPVVILMNTAAKYNEQDTKDRLQFDENLGIGLDIYIKDMNLIYPSVIKQAIKEKTKLSLRQEALRLLYVACTRAKEKLIIYGTVPSLDKYTKSILSVGNKKASSLVAATNNSHLKCILQAYMAKDTNFKLAVLNVKDFVKEAQNENIINRNESRFKPLHELVEKYEIKENKSKLKNLKDKLVIDIKIEDVNKKYTVTELKSNDTTLMLEELKPNVLEETVTSLSYGTFIHSVIESLDYNNISYDNILTIVKNKLLENEFKINIEKVADDIITMYENLSKYLTHAKTIKNELEFVIKDDLKDLDVALKEPSLIQGIVDMYVVTHDGKHIIIDFKTDRVESEIELIDRYKIQLKVYKKAIEKAYNVNVDATYIYSFSLKKCIEVK